MRTSLFPRLAACGAVVLLTFAAAHGPSVPPAAAGPSNPIDPKLQCGAAKTEVGSFGVTGILAPGHSISVSGSAEVVCGGVQPASSAWSLVSKPAGSKAQITPSSTPSTQLTIDAYGDYTVRLTGCPGGCTVKAPTPADPNRVVKAPAAFRDLTLKVMTPREVLVDAFTALRGRLEDNYKLTKGQSLTAGALPDLNGQAVLTYKQLKGDAGTITMEVQRANPTHVWVAVPHHVSATNDAVNAALWFEFARTLAGDYLPKSVDSLLSSTPYPAWGKQAQIPNTSDWSQDFLWGPLFGSKPAYDNRSPNTPHWVPVIVGNDKAIQLSGLDRLIHDTMWSDATAGMSLIQQHRTRSDDSLGDRAQQPWPPMMVRGTLTESEITDEDWGSAHTNKYHEATPDKEGDNDCDRGPYKNVENPTRIVDSNYPLLDWDMRVALDPDVTYAGAANHDSVNVEVEHFALAPGYRPPNPALGKIPPWMQAAGRLVVDTSHDDFATEIHPPELLVTSRFERPNSVDAYVTTTGAWMGEPISFVINPPPRPSPTAKLTWKFRRLDGKDGKDSEQGGTLTIRGIPSDEQPNHYVGTISGWGNPIFLRDNGAVCETNSRSIRTIVEASWVVEPTRVVAKLVDAGKPAKGAYLFYRRVDDGATAPWQHVKVDAEGKVDISGFAPERYAFRPAGSVYDFAGVPRVVELKPGTNDMVFTTAPRRVGQLPVARVPQARVSKAFLSVVGKLPLPSADPLATAAYDAYTLRALSIDLRPTTQSLAVAKNDLGLPSAQTVFIHLASIVDATGQPIKDFAASYKKPLAGPNGSQSYPGGAFLAGTAGPGVAGATLHVQLLLGNGDVGYRVAADLPSVTLDSQGSVALSFAAGTHVEDMAIAIDVTSNPVNAWFTPGVRTAEGVVFPAASTDDTVSPIAYSLTVAPTVQVAGALASFVDQVKAKQKRKTGLWKAIVGGGASIKVRTPAGKPFAPPPLPPELRKQLMLDAVTR